MDGLTRILAEAAEAGGRVVALTGAGISAESGIPTFRGKDGFWTVGSRNYRPEELATWRHFSSSPETVWPWYLYRLAACRDAQPNAGHLALVRLQEELAGRFRLVTQNVDGLHTRAGSDVGRTWHIHGNLEQMRCSQTCSRRTWPTPEGLRRFERGDTLQDADREQLRCASCGAWARPHVLWFDEYYEEDWFHYESALRAAFDCDLLLVIGTSGATNLPMQMGMAAVRGGSTVIDVNLEASPFTRFAEMSGGCLVMGPSGEVLPRIADEIVAAMK